MNQDKPKVDRRRYPRVKVDLEAQYRPEGASDKAPIRKDRLLSLCEGGCFVQTKLTYPKETRFEVSFTLQGEIIPVVASVRYAVPYNSRVGGVQFPGMGLQFEEIENRFLGVIREFVGKELASQGVDPTSLSSGSKSKT